MAAGVIALLIYFKWFDQRELIEAKTHAGVVTELRVVEETVQDRFGGGVRIQRYMHVELPDGRRLVRMLPNDWEARHPDVDLPGEGGLVWVREEVYNSGDPVLILDLSSLPTAL